MSKKFFIVALLCLVMAAVVSSCSKDSDDKTVETPKYSDQEILAAINGTQWVSEEDGWYWSFRANKRDDSDRTYDHNGQKVVLWYFYGDLVFNQNPNGYYVDLGAIHIMTQTSFNGGIDLDEGKSFNYFQECGTITPTQITDNMIVGTMVKHATRWIPYEDDGVVYTIHLKKN